MKDRFSRVSRVFRSLRSACFEVVGIVGLACGGGCSSTGNEAPSESHADAQALACPATPQDTVGKPCSLEGLTCGPQYACGIAEASLYCVCSGGAFQCRDGKGDVLNAGDALPCGSTPAPPPACPASEAAAQLLPCADVGQVCAYRSACAATFDACYCFAGETANGGFGKVFVCKPAVCGFDASVPPIDSGTTAFEDAAPSSG
jgi:hypothetical protein